MFNRILWMVLAVGVAASATVVAGEQPLLFLPKGSRMQLDGGWNSYARNSDGAEAHWSVEISRVDGDTFRGIVTLVEGRGATHGKLEGRLRWGEVVAEIVSEAGEPMGEVRGTLSREGVSGQFMLIDGEQGEWVWVWH